MDKANQSAQVGPYCYSIHCKNRCQMNALINAFEQQFINI